MSTAVSPASEYAECDEFIDYQIQTARDRIRWTDLLTALLLAAVLLIGYVLVFTICDHWVVTGGFAPGTRAIMLSVVVAVCCVIVYRYVIRPWTREIHPLYAARMLDESHAEMDGALMSLIDVSSSASATPPTAAIKRTMEKRAAVRLAEVNLDQAIERHWLMRLGGTLFALVGLMCLYVVISPKSINLLRPLSLSNAAVATRTRILKVAPGDVAIPAGTELEIVVDISGKSADNVFVMYSTRDQRFVDEQLAMQATEDQGRYRITMLGDADRGLRQDFTYHIIAGDATSEVFHVSVDQSPTVNVTQLAYSYPDYMVLPPRRTDNANIEVWEGTDIELKAEANVPIASARLVFSDEPTFETPAEEVRLTVDGQQLSGHFHMDLRDDGTSPKFYRVQLEDQEGRTDPAPTVYSVNVRPDQAPIVKLLDPIRDLRVPANAVISLLARAEDPDFLLRSVRLMIEVNGEPRSPEYLFDATRRGLKKSWSGQKEFRLEPLGLQEGDVVRYHLTARDNKPLLGSQSRTGTLQFNIGLPASQKEIDERLKLDKELQDQQRREMEREERLADQSETNDPDATASDSEADTSDASDDGAASNDATNDERTDRGPEDNRRGESGTTEDDPASQSKSDSGDEGDPESSESSETGKEPSSDSQQDGQQDGKENQERNAPASDDEALQKLLERYNQKAAQEEPPKSEDNEPQESGGKSGDGEKSTDSGAGSSNEADPEPPDDQKAFDDASTGIEQKMKPDAGDANPENGESPSTTDPGSSDANEAGPDVGPDGGESPKPTSDDTPSTDSSTTDESGDTAEDGADSKPEQDGTGTEPSADGVEKIEPTGAQQSPGDGNEEKEGDQQGKEGEQQSKEGDQQGKEGEQQSKDRDQQSKEGGQQGKDGEQQGKDGGQQGKDGGQQGKDGGQQGKDDGQQGKDGGQQGKEGGQQGKEGGQQGKEGGQQGKEGGQQGKEGGQQGKEGGQQGKEGGQQGKEGGQQGKDGGQQGKEGGQQGKEGGQQGKEGGQQGKEGGKDGGKQGGGGEQPAKSGQQGGQVSNSADQKSTENHLSKKAPGAGNVQGGPKDGEPSSGGGASAGDGKFKSDDPNVEDGAQAASMVLKRLQKELERGQVDQKLLEELGWTEDQLKSFSDRIQQQLSSLKDESPEDDMSEKLKRRRVEELLKSLDLTSKSGERVGSRTRDREQQDTTSRRSPPPSRYKDWLEMYQKSLNESR